jgi:hypothetical protein
VVGISTSGQVDDDRGDRDEKDMFLEALLHPNEHGQRLLDIRTRVAELYCVFDILHGVHLSVEDVLQSVVRSFGLLRAAGHMQDALILLADGPGRSLHWQESIRSIRSLEVTLERLRNARYPATFHRLL